MKTIIIASAYLLSSFVAFSATHMEHPNHAHVHGMNCGHVGEWHVDHVDYFDNGHDHHMHGGDVHEESFALHEDHDHVHAADCGHQMRVGNGNIVEFNHDGHWHHAHGGHVHEAH